MSQDPYCLLIFEDDADDDECYPCQFLCLFLTFIYIFYLVI